MKRYILKLAGMTAALALLGSVAQAQDKPAELRVGITTFTSGPASVFGVPGKAAAEVLIDQINANGGVGGAKLVPTWVDEGIGGDRLLSEYRRLDALGDFVGQLHDRRARRRRSQGAQSGLGLRH